MKNKLYVLAGMLVLFLSLCLTGRDEVSAAPGPVFIKEIDYETLEMKLDKNENTVIYLSADNKKTWSEVNGVTDQSGNLIMDISFASASSDVTLYFKGNKNMNVLKVTLPKQTSSLKAKFDSVSDEIDFTGYEDRAGFYWRKITDYNWNYVSFSSASDMADFNAQIPAWRFKGIKIICKLAQIKGGEVKSSDDEVGERPGKEVSITIGKYPAAPSVNINVSKLVFNTKDTLEYNAGGAWVACEKNMTLEDLLPGVADGSVKTATTLMFRTQATEKKPVSLTSVLTIPARDAAVKTATTLMFRTQATEKKPVSLTSVLTIPARDAAPSVGDNSADVTCLMVNGSLQIKFNTASKSCPLEYCIIDNDKTYDEYTARWRAVTGIKTVKITAKNSVAGTEVYFRFKGMAANASKKLPLKLPSLASKYTL